IDPRTLDFFGKVLAASDSNGDGVLTENEWNTMSKNPAAADVNKDGKITVGEYARFRTQQ
ncbi:MAG: hypothetical protein KDA62_05640, partial [Planctomycetales bacterium]|nr:hypothetical protein [Planctomycetales bacterium]